MEITPSDLREIDKKTKNVYEAVIATAKRARIINDTNKLEFNTLVNAQNQGLEDDFEDKENPDQIRISLEFENRPKPHLQALEELIKGDFEYRYKSDEEK